LTYGGSERKYGGAERNVIKSIIVKFVGHIIPLV